MSTGQNLCKEIDNESTTLSSTKFAKDDSKADEDEDKTQDKQTGGQGSQVLGHHSIIKNVLSKETQIKLRKNKYPFECKRHFEVQKNGRGGEKKKPQQPPTVTTSPSSSTNTPALVATKRKLIVDFRNKVYIAPLTTVGNLPFRRIMKQYGADITCGEMALADQLLMGKPSEWALLKRHPIEDVFGVQIAAGHADQYTRVAEVLANESSMEIDFVDLNLGCPIDLVCNKGSGAALMLRDKKLRGSLEGMTKVLHCPVTVKMRTGWNEKEPIAHELIPKIQSWGIDGIAAFMVSERCSLFFACISTTLRNALRYACLPCFFFFKLHGRSRLQRYSRLANWDYISQVACSQSPNFPQIPLIGNGDIFSYTDYEEKILKHVSNGEEEGDGGDNKNNLLPTAMLGRGALIKPWLPTEIKERRHWDISASERLDILKDFVRFGLEHWGSDQHGVSIIVMRYISKV